MTHSCYIIVTKKLGKQRKIYKMFLLPSITKLTFLGGTKIKMITEIREREREKDRDIYNDKERESKQYLFYHTFMYFVHL